jgi:hypothetical protein
MGFYFVVADFIVGGTRPTRLKLGGFPALSGICWLYAVYDLRDSLFGL